MKTLKVGDKLPNFECINENEEKLQRKDQELELILFPNPSGLFG